MEDFKKEKKLVAVYARVSTARQEEEKTIETQLSAVREHAKENGYTIVKEYIDDGWSGDILVRPQLDQLRQDAKDKIWEAVLAYDPDRLARRYSYQELVMDELREAGIEVLFVTTPVPRNGEEKILQGVKGLFAEYERAKITERFRLGKLRVVKEGHVLGSSPYGYTYILRRDKEHGYYEINEKEAKVVRKIFSWIAIEGLTIRKVVKRLQENGIKPRRGPRGVWSTGTMSKLLRNEVYIGDAHYGKTYAVVPERPLKTEKYRKNRKSSFRFRPRSEWIRIPVPAIIPRDLFELAQQKLKSNFELSKRNQKYSYLLTGKIWCTCGFRCNGRTQERDKRVYYRCTQRQHTYPLPSSCHEREINGSVAEKMIWEKLVSLMSSPALLSEHVKRWIERRHGKATETGTDIEAMKQEISKLKEEETRYTRAYGAGLFSLDKLAEYANPIRERISSLNDKIIKAEAKRKEKSDISLPRDGEIETFARTAAQKLHNLNFVTKQAILRNVVDRIVGSHKELHIYGFIPIPNSAGTSLCCSRGYDVNTIGKDANGAKGVPFEFRIALPSQSK